MAMPAKFTNVNSTKHENFCQVLFYLINVYIFASQSLFLRKMFPSKIFLKYFINDHVTSFTTESLNTCSGASPAMTRIKGSNLE